MGRVDGAAYVKVNIRGFLKEEPRDPGGPVFSRIPVDVVFIVRQVILVCLAALRTIQYFVL
jgi:hypothetical protein